MFDFIDLSSNVILLCADCKLKAVPTGYNYWLVALSFVISVLGSFTALLFAGRIATARGRTKWWWLAGAAAALGGGAVWSMHYIGMLAFQMPMSIQFNSVITLGSLAAAVLVTGIGLAVAHRGGVLNLLGGGLFTGFGVAIMHYTGMAGMETSAEMTYNIPLVCVSVAIAVVAATAALWLSLNLKSKWMKLAAAFVMGIAVCSMHYTGMAAAHFTYSADLAAAQTVSVASSTLGIFAFCVSLVFLSIGIVTAFGRSISTKLAMAVVSITAFFIFGASFFSTQVAHRRLQAEAETQRQFKVEAVQQKLESTNRLMLEQVQAAMRVLKREGTIAGAPNLTVEKGGASLFVGGANQSGSFAVVDKVNELVGAKAAVFAKSGADFVRVTTNVEAADGTRAVGTTLDANSRAIAELNAGKSFYGVDYTLDRPYITGYEPMTDAKGAIIGAWYVGYPLSSLEELGRNIQETKILDNGFLALQDDKGQVIFKSANAEDESLQRAIRATEAEGTIEDWNIKKTPFAPWGYTLISAYSNNDPLLASQVYTQQTNVFRSSLTFLLLLSVLVIVLTRRFMRPLKDAVETANALAVGRVHGENVHSKSNDEVGQMVNSLQGVKTYLQEMSGVADNIAAGNLSVKVNPRSEEDRFGTAFENMLEQTLRMVQTQDERDKLQHSIMKLLTEVADVADGDLTAEAEVTADATGAIADAFNYMIIELRRLISQVKNTSMKVDDSATEVQLTTETLMRRSQQQTDKLNNLSDSLEKMADALQQVSQDTNTSVRVADSALTSAKNGAGAMQNSLAAMSRLRLRVQETAERIKRLGERSQEISVIVKIINDLAQRTSILALNASIQAAAAGQQGRGFAAVAEEVEKLAERSGAASKQIDALTKAIQGETNEAVAAMEATVKEVLLGAKLTGEVGESLGEIETIAHKLAEISHDIAASARRQAIDSVEISSAVRTVAAVSEQNAAGMKNSAETVNQLAVWAQELRGSVASFRLPAETDSDTETKSPFTVSSGTAATIGV